MLTIDDIRVTAQKAAEYNATAPAGKLLVRIGLFGSYASGNAREDSDADFLVEFAKPAVFRHFYGDVLGWCGWFAAKDD